jgi:AAA15 family ATPase/GTPase
MIRKILIKNFKSIESLELELGRFNVLIGANGSGKSNLLEGIALATAALADKLNDEFLSTRIRMTQPKWMIAAFQATDKIQPIEFELVVEEGVLKVLRFQLIYEAEQWWLDHLKINNHLPQKNQLKEIVYIKNLLETLQTEMNGTFTQEKLKTLSEQFFQQFAIEQKNKELLLHWVAANHLDKFVIFAPENHFLRNFSEEGQIKPIGARGEGLFQHLVKLRDKKPEALTAIQEQLDILDWFGGFEIPNDLVFTERRIQIKDTFLNHRLDSFDQRSANEGFLYLLFYFTIFISPDTPSFLAIDNIDTALNPKLATDLMAVLVNLAAKYNKQVLFTTHNPAILDGLNLNDPEQRLLIVERNHIGRTKVRRFEKKPVNPSGSSVKLSERFMRGYIGGLNLGSSAFLT